MIDPFRDLAHRGRSLSCDGLFLGSFSQAFSHVGLVNTACNLTPGQAGPALHREGD